MREIIASRQSALSIVEADTNMYQKIVTTAEKYIGTRSIPYSRPERGNDPEDGFDCSGFVGYILNENNIYVPEKIRHANEFFDLYGILIHPAFRRSGDLIFFSYDGGVKPTHMGILLSPDAYIHAPGKENSFVAIEKLDRAVIAGGTDGKIYEENPIGFKRPTIKNGRYNYPLELPISS